jgi:hypothetical protein
MLDRVPERLNGIDEGVKLLSSHVAGLGLVADHFGAVGNGLASLVCTGQILNSGGLQCEETHQ